jgi:hypothetical protein
MSAEQFADAVSTVTGVWPRTTNDLAKVDGRGQGGQLDAVRIAVAAAGKEPASPPARVRAQWIWSHADAEHDRGGRILLRKVVRLDSVPPRAVAVATCDNALVLYVNGNRVAASDDWTRPISVEITKHLARGDNVIAVEATNWPDEEHERGTQVKGPNPAAFIAWIGGFEGERLVWGVGTDESWLWARSAPDNWKVQPSVETGGWSHTAQLPGAAALYHQVDLAGAIRNPSGTVGDAPIRAALVFDDPLLAALGRSSREQVVTRRDSIATTLQALELTNGSTLDASLKKGAERWLSTYGRDPERLTARVFATALGRPPLPRELAACTEMLGATLTVESVQDLLWAVTMLPEFQLID